jgi:hypothetical protein
MPPFVSFLTLIILALWPIAAYAEKRVALVIGNGSYQNASKLPNPTRDAHAVAELLGKAGFEIVQERNDLGNLDFKRALRDFSDMVQDSDIAVVFYAGHAIQIGDENYIIPVDAKLIREYDAQDEAVSLQRIVDAIEPAKRLRLVILDSCRDNPFIARMQRRVATRQIVSRGLARVEPTWVDTLVAFAAKAGSTAVDGDGDHSPFTSAILKHIAEPGLDIRLAFGRIRDDVLKSTNNEQEPFVYGTLGGSNTSLVPAPAVPKLEALADLKGDYELVERINTVKAWEVFLGAHKSGYYVDLARERHRLLAALPAPSEPANLTEETSAWNRVKDSNDRAAIRRFIDGYPSSPLATAAQQRLDALERDAQQREAEAERA